jgi:hypothetical protein
MNALTCIDFIMGCLCPDGLDKTPSGDDDVAIYIEPSRILFPEVFRRLGLTSTCSGKSLLQCDRLKLKKNKNYRVSLGALLKKRPDIHIYHFPKTRSGLNALKLFRAYIEVICDSYPEFLQKFTLDQQLEALYTMASWPEDDFVTYAKYFASYPMARYLKTSKDDINVLPSCPLNFNCHWSLYSGPIKRFFKNRLVSFNKKNTSYFLGILQGVKRSAHIVPDSMVRNSMFKHSDALSGPFIQRYVSMDDWSLRTSITSLFDRLWKKFKPSTPKIFEASPSAGLFSKRSDGGSRGTIRNFYRYDEPTFFPTIDEENPVETKRTNRLMNTDSDLLQMYESRPGQVKELRGDPTYPSLSSFRSDLRLIDKFDPGLLSATVMVAPILEPLKVRLITKGNDFHQYFARFFQKELWKYLNKFPQFSLTGKPVDTNDIYLMLEREKRCFEPIKTPYQPFDLFVSGDYSAATDNLKISYTKEAFESVLRKSHLESSDQDRLRSVLYEQTLTYPSWYAAFQPKLAPRLQTTGQLMGSILSFPILCAVNLCAYWMALEIYFNRQFKIYDLPVLVNGDDILFRTNKEFYSLWQDLVKEVGFTLSPGKNYAHKSFFTINSQGFNYNNQTLEIRETGFLNTGLLIGVPTKDVKPLYALYNDLMRGSQNRLRSHQRFLYYNKSDISKITNKGEFSLFISPSLGGCGFDFYPELFPITHFTNFQLRLAEYLDKKYLRETHTLSGKEMKLGSFRIPKMDVTTYKIKRDMYHYGRYRFIQQNQPLNEFERLPFLTPDPGFFNSGTVDTEDPNPSYVTSFPIKVINDFRLQLSNDKRSPKLITQILARKVDYYTKLRVKLIEEVDSIFIDGERKLSVPPSILLNSKLPFSMDEYMD